MRLYGTSVKFLFQVVLPLGLLSVITSCALDNNESKLLGPSKPGLIDSQNPGFGKDLWAEKEENKYLKNQEIQNWPKLEDNTILFIGDESLHGNWGLALEKSYTDPGKNSWFLSTCLTAVDYVDPGHKKASTCGYITAPFKKENQNEIYLTLDQKKGSESIIEKLISDSKTDKVVISIGHKIATMTDEKSIKNELSGIELLAYWAHSAGKTCYVIEPVGEFFVETKNNKMLSEEQKTLLKIAVQPYCYYIDANKLRKDFFEKVKIDIDQIITQQNENSQDEYILLNKDESVDLVTTTPELKFKEISTALDDLDVYHENGKTIDELLAQKLSEQERQRLLKIQKAEQEKIRLRELEAQMQRDLEATKKKADGLADSQEKKSQQEEARKALEEATENSSKKEDNENKKQEDSSADKPMREEPEYVVLPENVPVPTPRPERVSVVNQEQIRQAIESKSNNTSASTSTARPKVEPKYLWNGYAHGTKLTEVTKKYLADKSVGNRLLFTNELRDAKKYCPNYWNLNTIQRRHFWTFLFSAMAKHESTFNPQAKFKEDSSGRYSAGIMQVDTASCLGAGKGYDPYQKLFDIDLNMKCAIGKAADLTKKRSSQKNRYGYPEFITGGQIGDGYYKEIWYDKDVKKDGKWIKVKTSGKRYVDAGMGAFWSVLRGPYQYKNYDLGKRKIIIDATKRIEMCN